MIDFILAYLNLTQILVIVTLSYFLSFFNAGIKNHIRLLAALFTCFMTEIGAMVLIYLDNYEAIGLLYSISVLIHHGIWLYILVDSGKNIVLKSVVPVFAIFGVLNLFFLEGARQFNYYTFVMGTLLYVVIFIGMSFKNLKAENFGFFQSNNYILLFAPVMLFLGMSFTFSFRSHELSSTIVFKDVDLYAFLNSLVNIIYYGSIILYIYKAKKMKNE